MLKTRSKLALGAVTAAMGVTLALAPTAHASNTPWNLTHTAGDVVGAYARGSAHTYGTRNRVEVQGRLDDTKTDGKLAVFQLWAGYADGGRRHNVVRTSSGTDIDFNFASSVQWITAQECLGHYTAGHNWVWDKCAKGSKQIW
jgi:hypothetical protein